MDKRLSTRENIFIVTVIVLVTIAMLVFEVKTVFAQDYAEVLSRCEPYRQQVETILSVEGVDSQYYYLMVAESRCTPNAKSNKGALGFWQLMPSTSKHYGCFHPNDLDCATRAAAKYIYHLQKQFSKFEEVIMAYNMGGHNYKRLGATAQAKGLVYVVKQLMNADGGIDDDK